VKPSKHGLFIGIFVWFLAMAVGSLSANAQSFISTGSLNTARFLNTATLLPNGRVLVAGGENNNVPLASAELYDPTAGTFSATGSMTTARFFPTATLLPNGQVLVAGGYLVNCGPDCELLASAELYDPTAGTFTATGSMATARYSQTATLLPNGQVLMAAGYGNSGFLASAELYISVPTDTDECKKNGWMTLSMPDGSPFKNQGDCIQFVNTGK
jgi:Galactose oxidase, central domain